MAAFDLASTDLATSESIHEQVRAPLPIPSDAPASIAAASGNPALAWLPVVLMFALTSIGTFTGFYMHATSAARLSRPAILPHATLPLRVGMRVENRDDRLLVSWDRQLVALNSAKYGILSIDDGPKHHEIELAAAELVNGSILYKPASNDLTFRLEIHGPKGPPLTGIVRAFDGSTLVRAIVQAQRPPTVWSDLRRSAGDHQQHRLMQATGTKTFRPDSQPMPSPHFAASPDISLDSLQTSASLPSSIAAPRLPAFAFKQVSSPVPKPLQTQQTPAVIKPASLQSAARSPLAKSPDVRMPVIYYPPRPLRQVMPNTRSIGPSRVTEATEIDVEIKIDEKGRVVDAFVPKTRVNPGGPLLAQQVIAAAKQWIFEPAKLHGKTIPSDYLIRFSFRPEPR